MKKLICDCCGKQIGRKYFVEHAIQLHIQSSDEWTSHSDTKEDEVINELFDVCDKCVKDRIMPLFVSDISCSGFE